MHSYRLDYRAPDYVPYPRPDWEPYGWFETLAEAEYVAKGLEAWYKPYKMEWKVEPDHLAAAWVE